MIAKTPPRKERGKKGALRGQALHLRTLLLRRLDGLNVFDAQAVECAWSWLDELEGGLGQPLSYLSEQMVCLEDDDGEILTYGTYDRAYFDKEVTLVDFKFHPAGDIPEFSTGVQMSIYAAGILHGYPKAELVNIHVHAPHGPTTWVTALDRPQVDDTVEFVRDTIADSEKDDAPLRPSQEACAYCPAAGVCPALGSVARAVHVDPARYEVSLANLHMAKQVQKWAEAFKNELKEYLRQGNEIPGLELKERVGNRGWVGGAPLYEQLPEEVKKLIDPLTYGRMSHVRLTLLEAEFVREHAAINENKRGALKEAKSLFGELMENRIERGSSSYSVAVVKEDK